MIRAALIGFGYSGQTFHAPLLSATPGVELAAIVQRSGDLASAKYPASKLCRSVEQMLSLPDISLAVIATANPSHCAIAQQCLEAGRHVVLDKPMTVAAAEARQVARCALEHNRLLSVFHNRRWDGDFLTLRTLIAEGRLGRITRFTTAFDRYRPSVDENAWRQQKQPGSGVLWDLGPHLIDQALVAFGPPSQVFASIREERDGAHTDDAFDVTFFYGYGLVATMSASMLAVAPRPRFTVDGLFGSWLKLGLDPQEAALKAGQLPGAPGWGQEPANANGMLTVVADGGTGNGATTVERVPTMAGDYPAYYANVRDAILGTAKLQVPPEQAVAVMDLMELAREAHAQKSGLYYAPQPV